MAPLDPINVAIFKSGLEKPCRPDQVRSTYLNNFNLNTRHTEYRHTWGFTILRTVYTPESDDLVPVLLARLQEWVKFLHFAERSSSSAPNSILPTRPSPTEEMWARYRTALVEDREALDGVGMEEALAFFRRWRTQFDGIEEALRSGMIRFQDCLVLDDAALQSLKTLPEVPFLPGIDSNDLEAHQAAAEAVKAVRLKAWIWVLSEDAAEEGRNPHPRDKSRFKGWMRVHVNFLKTYWWQRFFTRNTVQFCEDEEGICWGFLEQTDL